MAAQLQRLAVPSTPLYFLEFLLPRQVQAMAASPRRVTGRCGFVIDGLGEWLVDLARGLVEGGEGQSIVDDAPMVEAVLRTDQARFARLLAGTLSDADRRTIRVEGDEALLLRLWAVIAAPR